uniref:Uncharacterized protein n=1 Tax=Anguilla anguilla TaxID=7936 RepID=A0A0E9QM23_ANGAN
MMYNSGIHSGCVMIIPLSFRKFRKSVLKSVF